MTTTVQPQPEPALEAPPQPAKPNYLYIDSLRGYAVLIVIACHVSRAYPELPYRAMQLLQFGWHGVQLFFLASSITLLLSWHHERRAGPPDVVAFFIRRYLRIAPAYYLAAFAYAVLFPPPVVDAAQAATVLAFANGWTPATMPTVAGRWNVVPGGWSIAVEFTFYFLFPLVASFAVGLRRVSLLLAGTLIAGGVANAAASSWLAAYPQAEVDNFLYFWFPNQASVFALGIVTFVLMRSRQFPPIERFRSLARRHGNRVAMFFIAIAAALSYIPLGQYIGQPPTVLPALLAISVVFCGIIFVFSEMTPTGLVNAPISALGRVSFSAYLAHFAVIDLTIRRYPGFFLTRWSGARSLPAYGLGLAATVLITYAVASVTFRFVEAPMMAWAKDIARRRRSAIR